MISERRSAMKKTGRKLIMLTLAFLISFTATFIPAGTENIYAAGTKSNYKVYSVKLNSSLVYYDGKYHKPKVASVWAYDTKTGNSFKLPSKYYYVTEGTGNGPKKHKKCGQYCFSVLGTGSYKGHKITGIEDVYWEIDLKPMKKSDIKAAYKGSKKDKLKFTISLPPHDGGYYLLIEDETTGETLYFKDTFHSKKRTLKKTLKVGAPNNHIYGVYVSAYGSVKKISSTQYSAYATDAYKRVGHYK